MKNFAFVIASVALSTSAIASDLTRKEMALSSTVAVTCVTVSASELQPVSKVDDHIPQGTDNKSFAFVRDGKAYFCNAVLK